MSDPSQDRRVEQERYNRRAGAILAANNLTSLGPDGAVSIPKELRAPYLRYEATIRATAQPGLAVLDLCCGDGVHSLTAAQLGAEVTISDIAESNLAVAQRRATRAGVSLRGVVANAESVPLPSASFDLLTCAGSLSYVDLEKFLAEVRRLLRPGGTFIFVDSLNHNPIYRFNRFIHYLRGRRSRSTLVRMPTVTTLETIRRDFPDLQVSYHGAFSFLLPGLRLFGSARAATWLDRVDAAYPVLKRYSFKVVGAGHRPI